MFSYKDDKKTDIISRRRDKRLEIERIQERKFKG
jgi:hypothetical protein